MKRAVILRSWMEGYGYRLDCQPYLGGALETKILLGKLACRKDPLHTLTAGFDGGIYNGPQFARNYVDSPEHGVPFITGSSMQLADLSNLPLLSRRDALSPRLAYLELKRGMSLISCSGTIGKMAYCRPEMDGMWSSQDVLKVVPDPAQIPSGYLYAFLSSKFGVPLVASGTYGAIIQHLEPEHIANLPVPRLGDALEREVHALVEQAAERRSQANGLRRQAVLAFMEVSGLVSPRPAREYSRPLLGFPSSQCLASRMDSGYYVVPNADARAAFDGSIARGGGVALRHVAEVFIPTIFKREYSDDPAFGYPYLTGADVFCIRPTSCQFLLRRVAAEHRLVLEDGMIVLHEAGQRYGLIGHSVMVGRTLRGFACTNNMVRVLPADARFAGFICAALCSEYGLRLVKREAAGSSIPHLDQGRVASLRIPWPAETARLRVSRLMDEALRSADEADALESRAGVLVEEAIEEGGRWRK